MVDEISNDQIDSQFSGSESDSPVFAEDVFDKAIEHYTSKPSPVGNKQLDADNGSDSDDQTQMQNDGGEEKDSTTTEEGSEDTQVAESTESEFKPYSFKGSVFGKEIDKNFESPEELNRVISKGLASETLYKRLKERDSIIEQLKADAESGKEFEQMAKEDPSRLMDLLIENYMDEQTAANKVLGLFDHYRNLARMSPEEREKDRKLKLADKLIREREAAEKAQQAATEREQQLKLEQQKADDRNWANTELRKQTARFQNLNPEVVKQQILNVMTRVKLSRQEGKPMSMQQATKLLNTYLQPFEQLSSPSATKKRLGDAVNQKKESATSTIQNAARQQARNTSNADAGSSGPMDSEDVFNLIKNKVARGEFKLR